MEKKKHSPEADEADHADVSSRWKTEAKGGVSKGEKGFVEEQKKHDPKANKILHNFVPFH